MSNKGFLGLVNCLPGQRALMLLCGIICLEGFAGRVAAADGEAAASDRPPAATCASETGSILRRQAPGKPWQMVAQKETLSTGDILLGTFGAMLDSKNGAVRLDFLTDIDGRSPFPVVESAVVLEEASGTDLSFNLDRGRVDLVNQKDKGSAHVRVRVRDDTWNLILAEPGSRIALELYGRWPRGVSFTKQPERNVVPTADLLFLVIKGEVNIKYKGIEHALSAPPGPALIEWDSVSGWDETPRRLEKLPPWAQESSEDTPKVKKRKILKAKFRQIAATKSIGAALDEFLESDDPDQRAYAVFAMGALDDLAGLAKALRETKHLDVWDNGVLALRHWIGRKPGQDQILYKGFVDVGKFSPVEAETALQLLHSFGESELARPETYETLIDFLGHNKLAIRGLAYWHLSRLVPAGKEIGYNPLDSKEARDAAIKKWKQLIPEGKLPPRPKVEKGTTNPSDN